MSALEEVSYESADDLLSDLRLTGRRWWTPPQSSCQWLFRGQGDARWPLVPRAWREDGLAILQPLRRDLQADVHGTVAAVFGDGMIPPREPRNRVVELLLQAASEYAAVQEFVHFADEVGHPLPMTALGDWEMYLRCQAPDHVHTTTGRIFSNMELAPTPALALAQHHGVPTRLLDWTRRPLFAAFFAADDAVRLRECADAPTQIAIWAVNEAALSPSSRLCKYTCARHQLSFLHAQDGLFLWDCGAHGYYAKHGEWPSFDTMLAEAGAGNEPVLRKLLLPIAEVEGLLDRLHVERVSRGHLMPTLDNITATLKDRWKRMHALKSD